MLAAQVAGHEPGRRLTRLDWGGVTLWVPLLGWWSHILIDIFSHSADYYAVPVLYPITMRGFDGVAWNTPWFMALNYLALAVTWAWLWRRGYCRPNLR